MLDNETLYIDQELAEALGWDATKRDSVPLTLSGWAPRYFAIARTGSDAGEHLTVPPCLLSNNPLP